MISIGRRALIAWKRLQVWIRKPLSQRGLVEFRRAALADGFDYGDISDEMLLLAIGTTAVAHHKESQSVAALVASVQMKVGITAGDLLCRAVMVAEEYQRGNRPFVG
jgi:hypothetical protein